MINLKVLSAAAVMALMLPLATPTESFAQIDKGMGGVRGGGGAPPAAGFSGGGRGGGGGFHGGGAPRFSGGGGGGGHYGGYGGGYRRHGGGGGFIPGAVIGGLLGGAIASQSYGYYGAPGYYAPGYYGGGYYDEGVIAVVPGGDAVAYCMRTYRSYDPRSGTYLGYDGLRHPCP